MRLFHLRFVSIRLVEDYLGLTSKGSKNGCYALLLMMRRILIYRRFSNRAIFGKFIPKVLLHSLPELSLIFALICTYNEQSAARATVPGGPSVPCSTAKAVEWDAAWSQNLDLSGRAALGVHVAAYEEDKAEGARPKKLQAEKTAEGIV
uniref:Asparagine synthetase domain-containing protein n=1 Tax=Brassica oleracea var. oleracea TaxID=109376 RepID=A0A0D3DEP0_BRAOL